MSKLSHGNNTDHSGPIGKPHAHRAASGAGDAGGLTFGPLMRGIISMRGASGAVDRHAVMLRGLNPQSVSFLIDRFLWPQRACIISLRNTDGASVHIPGQVKRCALDSGRTHACEVAFDAPVEMRKFIAGAAEEPVEDFPRRPERRT